MAASNRAVSSDFSLKADPSSEVLPTNKSVLIEHTDKFQVKFDRNLCLATQGRTNDRSITMSKQGNGVKPTLSVDSVISTCETLTPTELEEVVVRLQNMLATKSAVPLTPYSKIGPEDDTQAEANLSNPAPPFSFFTLPPEIRNFVYGHILPNHIRPRPQSEGAAVDTAILCTCKQINQEALSLFYDQAELSFVLDITSMNYTAEEISHIRAVVEREFPLNTFGQLPQAYEEFFSRFRNIAIELIFIRPLRHHGDFKPAADCLHRFAGGDKKFDHSRPQQLSVKFTGVHPLESFPWPMIPRIEKSLSSSYVDFAMIQETLIFEMRRWDNVLLEKMNLSYLYLFWNGDNALPIWFGKWFKDDSKREFQTWRLGTEKPEGGLRGFIHTSGRLEYV